jgi:hypothetical protein
MTCQGRRVDRHPVIRERIAMPRRRHFVFVGLLLPVSVAACGIEIEDWDLILLRPWPSPQASPADLGLDFEDLRIPSADGNELAAWFVPAVGGNARGTVLVHTGMEGNIGRYMSLLPWAAENDFNIFIYDYQGFGASEGEPSFSNFEPDARAVVDYLLSRPEPSAHVLVQLGGSLGSIPALSIAAATPDETVGVVVFGAFFTDQIGGLWLQTFVSPLFAPIGYITDLIWTANLPDFMNARLAIDRVQVPILAIIPEDDTLVPVAAQLIFFDALPEPKQLHWTSGDHSPDVIENDPPLGDAILQWAVQLDGLLPPGP